MKTKNNRKGFTIVELVIVIAVIAILAAVLIPTFGNIIEKANNSKLLQQLKNEYTEYTVTVDAEDIEEDIVIKIGDNYYEIEDGAPKTNDDGQFDTVAEADAAESGYWVADAEPASAWVSGVSADDSSDSNTDEELTA